MTERPLKIAPSILAADFARLGEEVKAAERAGADWIHVDVMDGSFVPNITMGALVVRALRDVTTLPLDVHLMVIQPERHIGVFAEAGARSISVHYEATTNIHRALMQINDAGCCAGIAINPHTTADSLVHLLPRVDLVNVMTVNPGFGGQSYLPEMSAKIARLREMIDQSGRGVDIEVDGGINGDTAREVIQAGANVLVMGTSLFQAKPGMVQVIKTIRSNL